MSGLTPEKEAELRGLLETDAFNLADMKQLYDALPDLLSSLSTERQAREADRALIAKCHKYNIDTAKQLDAAFAKRRTEIDCLKSLIAEKNVALETCSSASSWLDTWGSHVGSCVAGVKGADKCTCGLTAIRQDLRTALSSTEPKTGDSND